MNPEWMEYRRAADGERLGWISPVGDDFLAISILGKPLGDPTDYFSAEQRLETAGLSYLSGVWQLLQDGKTIRVRIAEVTPELIRVITDNFGAIDVPFTEIVLPFPAPAELQPLDQI